MLSGDLHLHFQTNRVPRGQLKDRSWKGHEEKFRKNCLRIVSESMVRTAGVGVAMCNGIAEIQAVADYVTTRDNNLDGIAEVIERFLPLL